MTTIAADSFGPSRATLSLARASSFACSRASMESLMTLACLSAATASSAACAASAGKGSRACGTGSRFAACGVVGADEAARGDAVEHAVARRARCGGRAIRPPRFRRLRQRDQQRRLGEGELERLLAEIGERRRPHAFEIAAEGSEGEISIERALSADLALDLQRAGDLPEFGGDCALGPRLDQPRDLHSQRRTAGDHMAADQPLRAGANEGANVDAVVLVEPAVLVGDEHREIARIDVVRGRRQAPAPIGQGEGPQQPAVAIDDDRRALDARQQDRAARGSPCSGSRTKARQGARPLRAQAPLRRRRRGGEEGVSRRALIRSATPTTFSQREKGTPPLPLGEGRGEGWAPPHFALTLSSPKAVRP